MFAKSRLLDPAYLAISTVAVVLAALLSFREPKLYEPYFGSLSPVVAIGGVCLAGWFALYLLDRGGSFLTARPETRVRDAGIAAAIAIPFMILVTAIDLAIPFSREMNVPLPSGLMFYPVMGYVVLLLFRAVPLAILEPILKRVAGRWSTRRRTILCIVIAACPEAIFQAMQPSLDDTLASLVAIHVFVFGLAELTVFHWFGFVSMFVFRMAYYAYWHMLWGHLRLSLLF